VATEGKVTIDKEVISTIAYLTALAVPGVASLGGGWASGLAEFFSKGVTRGVKVKVEDDSVRIDLALNVEYGVNLVEVGGRVQKDVAKAITSTIGMPVKEVNVLITNIS